MNQCLYGQITGYRSSADDHRVALMMKEGHGLINWSARDVWSNLLAPDLAPFIISLYTMIMHPYPSYTCCWKFAYRTLVNR